MINYEEDWICRVIFHWKGSVGARATLYALPASALAVAFHVFDDKVQEFRKESGISELTASNSWTAVTFILAILLSFRTTQALSRFWEGTSLLHQMRGEWFDAVSCLISFSHCAVPKRPWEVLVFRHTVVRLMSLCHGSALEEIADTDHLVAMDVFGLDYGTLRHLKECKREYGFNRVECLLHLLQTLVTNGMDDELLPIAPPILSRVYQTLSRGFVNLLNAKKITDTRFPFPYAQMIAMLLLLQLILTPSMMASLIPDPVVAAIFTFVPVFGFFSLNFAAAELENPFGSDDNDLPLTHFQTEMNSSLLMLLHRKADHVAGLSKVCIWDFDTLMTSGTRHRRHSLCSETSSKSADSWRPSCRPEPPPEPEPAPPEALAAPIPWEELEPKIALLSKQVEEFSLSLPQWTRMIETQVLELGRSFSAMVDLADSDKVEWKSDLSDAAVISLQCFPAL